MYCAQIAGDKLTVLAREKWGSQNDEYSRDVVEDIYDKELNGGLEEPPALKRIMVLEVSQYLEKYLWPNYDAKNVTYPELMSAVLMVNEKFREGMPAWSCFETAKVGIMESTS